MQIRLSPGRGSRAGFARSHLHAGQCSEDTVGFSPRLASVCAPETPTLGTCFLYFLMALSSPYVWKK